LFILSLPTYFVFSVPQVKLASAIASQVWNILRVEDLVECIYKPLIFWISISCQNQINRLLIRICFGFNQVTPMFSNIAWASIFITKVSWK
jgi:hypothetical protein